MNITEIIKTTEIAGAYGSEDGRDCTAVIELVLDEDAEQWRIRAKDEYSSGGTPMDEWHGRALTLPFSGAPCLVVSDSDHNKLLDAFAPIADDLAEVAAGHSVEWDGSNHWGRLTKEAQVALERVRAFCHELPGYEEITGNTTWTVEALLGPDFYDEYPQDPTNFGCTGNPKEDAEVLEADAEGPVFGGAEEIQQHLESAIMGHLEKLAEELDFMDEAGRAAEFPKLVKRIELVANDPNNSKQNEAATLLSYLSTLPAHAPARNLPAHAPAPAPE